MITKNYLEKMILKYAQDIVDNEKVKALMQCEPHEPSYTDLIITQHISIIQAKTMIKIYKDNFDELNSEIMGIEKTINEAGEGIRRFFMSQGRLSYLFEQRLKKDLEG